MYKCTNVQMYKVLFLIYLKKDYFYFYMERKLKDVFGNEITIIFSNSKKKKKGNTPGKKWLK